MTGTGTLRYPGAGRRSLTVAILAAALGAGCGQEEETGSGTPSEGRDEADDSAVTVSVSGAWARPATVFEGDTVPTNSAAYMVIVAEVPDTVVGVSSSVARTVELHESAMAGGVMTMRPVAVLPVGPAAPVVLEPGGLHVMLFGLHRSLEQGDSITIVVRFASGVEARVNAPIRHTPPDG